MKNLIDRNQSYRNYLSPGTEDLLLQSENHASIPSVILLVRCNCKKWIHYHVEKSVCHTQEVVQIHGDQFSDEWKSDEGNVLVKKMGYKKIQELFVYNR